MVEGIPFVRGLPDLVSRRRALRYATALALLLVGVWFALDRAAVSAGRRSFVVTGVSVGLFFALFITLAYPILERAARAQPIPAPDNADDTISRGPPGCTGPASAARRRGIVLRFSQRLRLPHQRRRHHHGRSRTLFPGQTARTTHVPPLRHRGCHHSVRAMACALAARSRRARSTQRRGRRPGLVCATARALHIGGFRRRKGRVTARNADNIDSVSPSGATARFQPSHCWTHRSHRRIPRRVTSGWWTSVGDVGRCRHGPVAHQADRPVFSARWRELMK
jgi:hypothetical protein